MASSSQSSSSSSTPTIVETPENQIIDQISGVASGLAQQMLGWAQGVFAQTSAITNQAVGNFFNVSQQMLGLSNNLTGQYNNLFAPENAQLVADANSYNSAARQKVDMGMAGATQAQAGDAALKNSEEQLRSYGIDPSSGRYAALDKAAAVQNAANVAGAENMQRQQDITTGQNLRSQAVQVGAQLPAAIANVNNTAIQANTGASNASLANANTGANLMKLPNDYLGTAMNVKLPPVGQTSTSQSNGMSSSPDKSGGPSSGGGPAGGSPGSGAGGGGGGPAWMPNHGTAQAPAAGGGGGGGRIQPGTAAGIRNVPDSLQNQDDWSGSSGIGGYDPLAGVNADDFSFGYNPQDGYNMGVGASGYSDNPIDYTSGQYQDPFSDTGFGQTLPNDYSGFGGPDQTFGNMGGGTDTEFGNISYDPSANSVDPGWGQTYDQPVQTDWGNGADQYTGGGGSDDYSGGGGGGYDYSGSDGDYSDYSGGGDYGFAAGGPVSPNLSPSGGRQTDDIPAQLPSGGRARLNANEFVVPEDVATWKGHEFFQNLIDQSRKKRMGASAKPQPMRR